MKEVRYRAGGRVTSARQKLARFWHGPKRKTLVYSVPKALITFPEKEKVCRFNSLFKTAII